MKAVQLILLLTLSIFANGIQAKKKKCKCKKELNLLTEMIENIEEDVTMLKDLKMDCEWDVWSAWSDCTASCGGGTQFRQRIIKQSECGCGLPCEGQDIEQISCGTDACPGPIADCYDVFKANGNLPGIYTLQPDSEHQFQAYCLEYGWTAIQSRGQYGNPKDFFLKNWDQYVTGFGEPGKEYWLGLDNIYALTNRPGVKMNLRVSMEKFGDEKATSYYDDFSLKDKPLYKLNLGQFSSSIVPTNSGLFRYSGTWSDSLSYHNGGAFSTIDKDNDEHSTNCAEVYKGAWWYKGCHTSHLNGLNYGTGESTPSGTGIGWRGFNGLHDSLKSDVMAIRPMFYN